MNTHTWTTRAACADRPDLPWTTNTTDLHPLTVATMRDICARCPALFDCLEAVDALEVTGGFWAGRDRDPDAPASAPAPDWATTAPATVPAPVGREPMVCWQPRTRKGRVYQQAAYVIQSDEAGAWHLGGVA